MSAFVSQPRTRHLVAWGLQLLLALAFLGAGLSKLAGAAMMVDLFDAIGVGQWFRHVTGLVEVSGAALLLVPGLAVAGAALLGTTMAFATLTHLFVLHDNPTPALVLLALNLVLLALRRDQATTLRARLGRAL